MRDEYIKHGNVLPSFFPSGPHNPMGLYALYLGQNYAIHGTNKKFGIGLRVTRGCIRLRPQDIKYLFKIVPVGTKVQFINEPIKSTIENNGMRYLEVHRPLSNNVTEIKSSNLSKITHLKKQIQQILISNDPNIDYEIVHRALLEQSGLPINITRSPFKH